MAATCLLILLNLHFVLIYCFSKFLIAVLYHVQLIKTFKNYERQLSRAEQHGFSLGGKCDQQVIKAVINKTMTKQKLRTTTLKPLRAWKLKRAQNQFSVFDDMLCLHCINCTIDWKGSLLGVFVFFLIWIPLKVYFGIIFPPPKLKSKCRKRAEL